LYSRSESKAESKRSSKGVEDGGGGGSASAKEGNETKAEAKDAPSAFRLLGELPGLPGGRNPMENVRLSVTAVHALFDLIEIVSSTGEENTHAATNDENAGAGNIDICLEERDRRGKAHSVDPVYSLASFRKMKKIVRCFLV
jgi:hypothetical protein